MSIADLTPESVKAAVRSGHTSRAHLADHFEVLPTSKFLTDALDPLITSGEVVEHDGGVLHVNDLIEQLPHEPTEGR